MNPACLQDQMAQKLRDCLAPTSLEIEDQSHAHAAHNPAAQAGNTHFRITLTSAAFVGKTPVERHRMVFAALQTWMNNPIHALSIQAHACTVNKPALIEEAVRKV